SSDVCSADLLLVAKVHAQDAVGHALGALGALALADQLAQLDGGGELHPGLAPQEQDGQQLAQPPGDRPAVGEQQLPGAGLAGRRLAQNTLTGTICASARALWLTRVTRRVRVGAITGLPRRPSQRDGASRKK